MSLSQNKSRSSLLNAISAICLTLVNGLLGIVSTRFIISQFGSDFNGLNSTANQIVNVLLVLEGGFTVASNVALFAPMHQEDYDLVNGILSATRKKFRMIGVSFLLIGIGVALVYSGIVNSSLPNEFVATVILMTVVPAAFNLFYATTYRVLLQTQQSEYIISLITICTIGAGHIANIIMILLGGPMWMVRFNTMVCALLNSLLIAGYVKRKAKFLNLNAQPRQELIKGTGDVMAQKITGVIYNSAPIVFLSISPTGGTLLASVYAVYNNVFTMLKSLLHGVIDAPRHSFGQMLTERKREDVWPVFAQYEYIAFSAVFVLMTTCCALIIPFIKLYMDGITDANYVDPVIALMMVIIGVVEMIHIPSGHLINMAGEFAIGRNFQVVSCAVLLVTMTVGGSVWGVYGMLAAIALVAMLLAVLEMGYVHTRFFHKKLGPLMGLLLPMMVTGVMLCTIEFSLPLHLTGYGAFILYGILLFSINTAAAVVIGFLFNRPYLSGMVRRVVKMLKR